LIQLKKYLHIHAASVLCFVLFVYMSPTTMSQTTTITTTVTTTVTQTTNGTRTTTTVFQTTSVAVLTTITKANITITTSTTSAVTILVGIITITQANVTITLPTTTTATPSTVTVPTYSYMTVFTPVTFTTYMTALTTETTTRMSTETVTSPTTFSTTLTTTKPLTVTSVSTTTTSVLTKTLLVPSFGKCVIASATYGSDLAPEVQLLRMFRDQFLLKTFTGSAFMKAFNAFYYSFSPTVAELVSSHPTAGELMRRILHPLIGILDLSFQTYFFFVSYGKELAVVAVGLLAALLIGAVYLSSLIMLLLYGMDRRRILALKSLLCS